MRILSFNVVTVLSFIILSNTHSSFALPGTFPVTHCLIDSIPAVNDTTPKNPEEVEIQAEYPGGNAFWKMYLSKHLQYPEEAIDKNISGDVEVKFHVDKNGRVSNITAISGPEELRKEAVRLIHDSKIWVPAILNGRQVAAYKIQVIKFRLGGN